MRLVARPLEPEAFAPFGHVAEAGEGGFRLINEGLCRRFDDLLPMDVFDGRPGVSLFAAALRPTPHRVDLMERHPLGSQAFIPMAGSECLAIAAPDAGGAPGAPVAFHARAEQAFCFGRGVWHGVLAPIAGSGLYAVVDRIGPGPNLEEARLGESVSVSLC